MINAQTAATQAEMTPASALAALREGHERFRAGKPAARNLREQVEQTSGGQWPFAVVLSCVDSRAPAELLLDQGIGDMFNIRIAGNFVNEDILGSMEFACKVAGAKLILVLGHTACGAIKGACDSVELGNLTGMLAKLRPAVDATPEPTDPAQRTSANAVFVDDVGRRNVEQTIANIRERSQVLREMAEEGAIAIAGAIYDVRTGTVEFGDLAS